MLRGNRGVPLNRMRPLRGYEGKRDVARRVGFRDGGGLKSTRHPTGVVSEACCLGDWGFDITLL